jgi:hypothetical protein
MIMMLGNICAHIFNDYLDKCKMHNRVVSS